MIKHFFPTCLKLCKTCRIIVNFNAGTQFISYSSFTKPKSKLLTFKVLAFSSNFDYKPIHLSKTLFSLENDNSYINDERVRLQNWLKLKKFDGQDVPENISEYDFQYLLNCPNNSQKQKYLNFLCKRKLHKEIKSEKKEKWKEMISTWAEERCKANTFDHIHYGLWRNSMFAKCFDDTVLNLYHYNLASSMIYGQKVVLDMDFDNEMRGTEFNCLANELLNLITKNRQNADPFNLTICNADLKSKTLKMLEKKIPNLFYSQFPINITSKSYLDLYPKDKLIYLTPDSRTEMTRLNPDAIYIIGGMIELGRQLPVTFAKAKKNSIKTQKFPVDRYHVFRKSKSLRIDVVLAILLDLQETGNWKTAFQNLPRNSIFY